MSERNLNFDEIINRKGTDCLKYDFAEKKRYAGRRASSLGGRYGF